MIGVRMIRPSLNGILGGLDELGFVTVNLIENEMGLDGGSDLGCQRLVRCRAGFGPDNRLVIQQRQGVFGAPSAPLSSTVDHAQETGDRLAPFAGGADIGQQLREHQQRGGQGDFLGLEPDFRGLDIDQPLGHAFESKRP